MKNRMFYTHMRVAEEYSKLSYALKLQVGAIVVKEDRIISIGYNGTPAGWDNACEDQYYLDDFHVKLTTKPEVIHAEANAISKLARTHESGLNADMFITHAPCMECSKLIYGAGIKRVFYKNEYRDTSGTDFLKKCGIEVIKVN